MLQCKTVFGPLYHPSENNNNNKLSAQSDRDKMYHILRIYQKLFTYSNIKITYNKKRLSKSNIILHLIKHTYPFHRLAIRAEAQWGLGVIKRGVFPHRGQLPDVRPPLHWAPCQSLPEYTYGWFYTDALTSILNDTSSANIPRIIFVLDIYKYYP